MASDDSATAERLDSAIAEINSSLRNSAPVPSITSPTNHELSDLSVADYASKRSVSFAEDTKPAASETAANNAANEGALRKSVRGGKAASSDRIEWNFHEYKFDMEQLPEDIRIPYSRVKQKIEREFGEEYALQIIFTMLTAEHLHRAWNMTPLTSNVMKELKKRFNLRMTWELGVLRLKFRIEDGGEPPAYPHPTLTSPSIHP